MKLLQIFLLIIMICAPFLAVAQTTPQTTWDRHPEWFACQNDNECLSQCVAFHPVAINKQYADHANDIAEEFFCAQCLGCSPEYAARCSNHKCKEVKQSERIECQRDDDCALVQMSCADMAVNKLYQGEFKPADLSCNTSTWHHPNAVAKCVMF